MTTDIVQEVKDGLTKMEQKAAEAMRALEAYKSEVAPKLGKLSAEDQVKIEKLEKSIGEAVELSQKEAGARKAFEDDHKAVKEKLSALETAMSRPGFGSGSSEEKAAEIAKKSTKLLNDFAREPGQMHLDEFMAKRAENDAEIKSMSVNSDPNGGYLVFPKIAAVMQTYAYESSPIRLLASVDTVGNSDTLEIPLDNDEADAGWVGETQSRTDTKTPTLGKLTIPVNEIYAQPKVTQKMLDDAQMDIEAWLAKKVGEKFARKEATAFVAGNGVMQPKGMLSYASGTNVALQQIEQIASLSASTVTYDGLVGFQNALKEPYQANASFLLRRSSNTDVMKIKDSQNRPIFNMSYDKNVGLQPTIMGQTAYFAADMPAVATNALAMIYGDIRTAYQIVDRIGIRILRDPFTSKPYIVFYTTKRVGGAVVNFEALKIMKISAS